MTLLGLTNFATADEPNVVIKAHEPKFVSKTFQEITSRVVRRDAQSGAILGVRVKEDAPTSFDALDFSVEEIAHASEAVIVLGFRMKSGDGVYEKYRLRIDDALRQEILNQQRLKVLEAERVATGIQSRKKKITDLSSGKLSYGMTLEEVIKIYGQPQKAHDAQAAGSFTVVYPDRNLSFWMMKLMDIELTHK